MCCWTGGGSVVLNRILISHKEKAQRVFMISKNNKIIIVVSIEIRARDSARSFDPEADYSRYKLGYLKDSNAAAHSVDTGIS